MMPHTTTIDPLTDPIAILREETGLDFDMHEFTGSGIDLDRLREAARQVIEEVVDLRIQSHEEWLRAEDTADLMCEDAREVTAEYRVSADSVGVDRRWSSEPIEGDRGERHAIALVEHLNDERTGVVRNAQVERRRVVRGGWVTP